MKSICPRSRSCIRSDGKQPQSVLHAGVGADNTETNRRDWRELLYTAPGLGQYISGAIMFEETLYQSCEDGTPFVDVLKKQGIVPGIKVDTGLSVRPSNTSAACCIGAPSAIPCRGRALQGLAAGWTTDQAGQGRCETLFAIYDTRSSCISAEQEWV